MLTTEQHQSGNTAKTVPLSSMLREVTERGRHLDEVDAVPVLSITRHNGLVLQSEKFTKRIAGRDLSAYKVVRHGNLVCGFPLDEGVIDSLQSQRVGLVSPAYGVWEVVSPDVYPPYLARLLRTPLMLSLFDRLSSRTVHRRRVVKKDDFLSIRILLPAIEQQYSIERFLQTVKTSINAQRKVISAALKLHASLVNHLFTFGTARFSDCAKVDLRDVDDAAMPSHWGTTHLGANARIGNGSTPRRTNPEYWRDGGIPWLTSGKVHDGVIRSADEFVTERAFRECHLPLVPQGSLVMAITGQGKTLGNTALMAINATVSQHLAYITFAEGRELNPEFALAYLRSRYSHFQAVGKAGGSTKGALTCSFLKSVQIPVPPPNEQESITRSIANVSRKIEIERNRENCLTQLYVVLSQRLMEQQLLPMRIDDSID